MNIDDTIAAITTPPGQGGIGMVRICGPKAIAIADAIFKTPSNISPSQFASHTIHFGRIAENDSVIDEGLLSLMKAPHTYTGQDTVEFSLHGGPAVLRQALRCCLRAGARQACPGEFTFRAFALGKTDLARAEAVCDIITAKTDAAAKASMRMLEGALSSKIKAWRETIVSCLARLEASIDHSGEDFTAITPQELVDSLAALRNGIAKLLQSYTKARHLRCGISAVICGRPNVGKSSLMNTLLEKDRAIVSDIPGTTRDTIEETLDINGIPVVLTDTAGLRCESSEPIEAIGHERARKAIARADVVLWMVDGSQPLNSDDKSIEGMLSGPALFSKTIILINKSDLAQKLNISELPCSNKIIHISCTKASGLQALEQSIIECAGGAPAGPETIYINERHCQTLKNADCALAEAQSALAGRAGEDILAFHVREALDYLGEITGDTASEEILEQIFSKFCIGK